MTRTVPQYTLRSVPADLDDALRARAKEEGKSLNQVVLEALRRGLGVAGSAVIRRDLDDIAGTWVEDPEFAQAMENQDRIDEEMWR